MTQKKPLRERIREAGGLYLYINTRLIKYAGPAARGPYGPRVEPPCGRCGRPKAEHVRTADGGLACPGSGDAGA